MPIFQSPETMFEKIKSKRTRNGGRYKLPDWPQEFVIQQFERTAHQTAVGQVACALLSLQGVLEVSELDRNANSETVTSELDPVQFPVDIQILLEYLPAPILITIFTTPQELSDGERQLQVLHAQKQESGMIPSELHFDNWLLSQGRLLLLAQQNTKPGKIRDRVRHRLPRTTGLL